MGNIMSNVIAVFRDNNKVYEFIPQKDITAYELALLLPVANSRRLTAEGSATKYLQENNLMRHFVEREA